MKNNQIREINYCKEHYPAYVHYLTEDLNGTRMSQYNRLFKYDITPENNSEIFETIKSTSSSLITEIVSECIRSELRRRYLDSFIDNLNKSMVPLPKEKFTVEDYERIEVKVTKVKSPENNSKHEDYIHVDIEIFQGSLEEKIEFVKKYKKLIKFKVWYTLEKKYGNLIKFMKMYEYKFYKIDTVGDHGLVKGIMRFEWKEV